MSELTLEEVFDLAVDSTPVLDGEAVALVFGDETFVVLLRDTRSVFVTFFHEIFDFVKVDVILHTGRYSRGRRKTERQAFHAVCGFGCFIGTVFVKNLRENFFQLFFVLDIVVVREILWENFVEEHAP